ncbi:G-type lectin S-receptor-like serine/threonine-protein kinase SD3-1 [Vitis vinifera]|uniref:G-type lectin S-receptor-like serine/threonine-protein kinase SD3-1 n=1 Tax=Vitis vinifera TaxID=29760 RepID=A0A438ELY8_VITVI|nr:G-type lectin S-receptor-like serine/threonine-protein kinase SD3-1 [Vitis vinifera]
MVSVPLGFEISGFDSSRIWVSHNGVFAFGFLEGCEKVDGVDGFVVGIGYNLGTRAANKPVWTIGGGLRVSENSTLRLSMDGRLVLVENPNGLVVWSSNTSGLGVQKASLLDNGNLVLLGNADKVLWESFNSPTSTLLPGQSLHFPQTLRAPSTKTISSYYSLVIRGSGELALVWENNVTYWRSHAQLSSSVIVKEARFDSNGVLGLFDSANRTVWSKSSKDFEDPSLVWRHLRIDSDGNLRIYSWDNAIRAWRVGWQAVEDQCNVFGSCGLYSLCGYNSTGPVCDCLYEDSLNLGTGSYGMDSDVDIMLSEEACREYCSNDTTCIAVTSKNDGSGLCTIKRTSFISGYRNPSVPATSFLKVCLVPQAVLAHGANPHGNSGQIQMLSKRYFAYGANSKKFVEAIALIVLVTLVGFLTMEMFVFWFIHRRRKIEAQTRIPFGKDAQMNSHYSVLIRLSFEEIKELTANFATQLGPSVFKGVLPNKTPVVAKVLNNVVASEKDFRVAVSTLGGTHHRNLVSLKGFCFEPEHKFLLYEYIPNGSLDELLFSTKWNQNEVDWQQRLDIALGSLLQEEPASSSESPSERDIYMFGVMLLQTLTCQRDVHGDNLHHLIDKMNQEQKLKGSEEWEGVERVVRIALWCMQNQPFLRPSIGEVVKVLEGTLSVDKPPSAFPFRRESRMDERVLTEIEEVP